MEKVLLIGADVHDQTVLACFSVDRGAVATRSFRAHRKGRQAMIEFFVTWAKRAGVSRIVFAYEASGCGFLLHDELVAAGIECHVLAPSRIERSAKQRRRKTDQHDAEHLLELLRGAILGGNPLPDVCVPDPQTRDDREMTRARLKLTDKATGVRAEVQALLKRNGLEKPESVGGRWTRGYGRWLAGLAQEGSALGPGARQVLNSLRRQLAALEAEIEALDLALEALAATPRYAPRVAALRKITGVGLFAALVFLTEMIHPERFTNRRQTSAYLGLAPCSHETGTQTDRKGHITRQGSVRLRRVLCQSTWVRLRYDELTRARYARLVRKNPNKKKIAVVACMRQLGILMWHKAVDSLTPRAG